MCLVYLIEDCLSHVFSIFYARSPIIAYLIALIDIFWGVCLSSLQPSPRRERNGVGRCTPRATSAESGGSVGKFGRPCFVHRCRP